MSGSADGRMTDQVARPSVRALGSIARAVILGALFLSAYPPIRLSAQASAPAYTPAQLTCVTFDVRVHTTVNTELQGRTRHEELQRDGHLVVRGTAADGGIAIEAWWDSLQLARRADEGTLEPDPSGILGGRYRGLLHPDGRFERSAAPWVPDEVAEVSDLAVALDDLFPVFTPGTVRRLSSRGDITRYRLTSTSSTDAPATAERPFAVLESASSEGVVGWDREGLQSWVRTIRSETRVKESPRRTFRTRVTQEIRLQRADWCGSGAAGGIAR